MCVCVRARTRACVRMHMCACACACMRVVHDVFHILGQKLTASVCVCEYMCVCVCVCVYIYIYIYIYYWRDKLVEHRHLLSLRPAIASGSMSTHIPEHNMFVRMQTFRNNEVLQGMSTHAHSGT